MVSQNIGAFKMKKGITKVTEFFMKQSAIAKLMADEEVQIAGRVVAVLANIITGERKIIHGLNIVTNDGDQYYAQMSCGETPDDDFDAGTAGIRLGSDNTAPTKTDTDVTTFLTGTNKALEAAYPKTADADPDNTGAGPDIVTWLYSYTTAQGNATGIIEGAITDVHAGPTTAALTHFLFAASFDKTSSDTLKIFVNHEMNGV